MAEDPSPPVVPRQPLCGSLASGPTTAAHLSSHVHARLLRQNHHHGAQKPQSIWPCWAAHA